MKKYEPDVEPVAAEWLEIYALLKRGGEPAADAQAPYFERLERLTADEWRRSG